MPICRYSSKCFTFIISFTVVTALWGGCDYSHFTDKETGTESCGCCHSDLTKHLKAIKMGGGRNFKKVPSHI